MIEDFQSVRPETISPSTGGRWLDVKAIFELAATLDPSEWSALLDLRCGSDQQLRSEVASLLSAHDPTSKFLEQPLALIKELAEIEDAPRMQAPEIGSRIGAYRIEREIGRGGMGSVYLANRADDEFSQRVAIKVIRVERHSEFAVRRFRLERQILATLEHPYVSRLIDGGTTDAGLPYLVMEYVEGDVLTRYCDTHELALQERLELFVRVCAAVQYAHERNIVHRDLKPGNILVQKNGNPKLLDFGIAKILEPVNPGASKEATVGGFRMLTPAYAAPEQLQAEPATARSDIYSLGVILYELLCGERPSLTTMQLGSGGNRDAEEHLSPNLRAVVLNAIRLDPNERYDSVAAFTEDLRRCLRGLPTKAVLRSDTEPEADRISIGVFPFRELGQDTMAHGLGSAITDALITRLSKVNRLSVRPTSVMLRHSEVKDVTQVARQLRVKYLLEGTSYCYEDRVRINVQLVSSETGLAVWASTFEELSGGLLRLQDSIAEQITYALMPQLISEEPFRLSIAGTSSGKAHEAYLRGRYHWNRAAGEPDRLVKSLVYFTQAIAEDPDYARAYAGVADYYVRLGMWGGLPPAESFAAGLEYARKALELDPELSEAHASFGFCTWAYDHEDVTVERELHVAVARNPDSANAHHWCGLFYSARNQPELAIANLDRARKIDPNSPSIASALGFVYYNARLYPRAVELLRVASRELRDSGLVYEMLAWCYLRLDDARLALESARHAVQLSGRTSSALAALGTAELASGNQALAMEVLHELEQMQGKQYVSGYDRALLAVALGQTGQALDCLEEASAARDWWTCWLMVDPRWDALRRQARFEDLVAQTRSADLTRTKPNAKASLKGLRQGNGLKAAVVAAIVTALLVVTVLAWNHSHAVVPPFTNAHFTRLTGDGTAGLAAVSPDGRYIVYTTVKGGWTYFWRRAVGSSSSQELRPAMQGDVLELEFTSNGAEIAFEINPTLEHHHRRLLFAPLFNGPTREVLPEVSGPIGLSHDGRWAATVRAKPTLNRDEIWIVDLQQGGERMLKYRRYPEHLSWQASPCWSRDGKLIAFPVEGRDAAGFVIYIETIDVETGELRRVKCPRWLWVEHITWIGNTSGFTIVARSQGSSFRQIWYVPYPSGQAHRLGNDIDSYSGASTTDSASMIVSVQLQTLSNIYSTSLKNVAHVSQITAGSGRYFDLALTPTGRVLYASDSTGEAVIWSIKADGSDPQQITTDSLNWAPATSPDGRFVAFHTNRSGSWNIWRANADGSNPIQLTIGSEDSNWPQFTADGKSIVFHRKNLEGSWNIWRVPVAGGTPVQLTTVMTTHPSVSPVDGKIVAWYSEAAEKPLWKIAIFKPEGGKPIRVFAPATAISPDSRLAWSPAGDAITCLGQQNGVWNLWMQPLNGRPAWPLTSYTAGQIYSFVWSKDGRLFFSRGITTSDVVMVRDKGGNDKRAN